MVYNLFMSSGLDVFCIGKTTIDQFLILNESTFKYHMDTNGYLSFKHGDKIDVERFDFCVGGNATNVAIGLSRLGIGAGLCSEVGDDEFSEKIDRILESEKIDRSHMIRTRGARSSFSVIINFLGERTIFMQRAKREHRFNFDDVTAAKFIFLTSLEKEWQETYRQVLAVLMKEGQKLVFNPGTLQLRDGREMVEKILRRTDILFVNKEEAEEVIFGHEKRKRDNHVSYIRELLVSLQKMGAKVVVITNGRYGSHAVDEYGNFFHEGLFQGEVVERTGAGDSYTSGFLGAIIYGHSIKEAMEWGAVNASSVVEYVGATEGLLSRTELEKRLSMSVKIPQLERVYKSE